MSWLIERDNPFTRTNRAAVIIDHLDLKQGMNVLDAGCGPGRLSIPLAKKIGPVGNITALDMQKNMLKRTKEKAEQENLKNITYLHEKLESGKLPSDVYDRALLVTVLGEIPDPEKALKEIYQSLKPNGILSITEVIFDPHFQSKKIVLRLAQSIGFQVKEIFGNRFAYTILLEKDNAQQRQSKQLRVKSVYF